MSNKSIITISHILLTFLLLLLYFIIGDGIYDFNTIFIISTFSYLWLIISLKIYRKNFLCLYTLFLVLTYFFYYGQYLINFLGGDLYGLLTINYKYSQYQYNKTAFFTLVAIFFLQVGYLSINLKTSNRRWFSLLPKSNIKGARKAATIMLLIGYLPAIFLRIKAMMNVLRYGYSATLDGTLSSGGLIERAMSLLANFGIAGLLMALIAFRKTKYEKIIWALNIFYIAIYFMSGSRYKGLLLIATLLLYYHQNVKYLKFKDFILLIAGGVGLSLLLIVISSIRNASINAGGLLDAISMSFAASSKDNYIYNLISQIGSTAVTNTCVLENCPSPIPYNYGLSYLVNIIKIIPDFLGLFRNVKDVDTIFHGFLTPNSGIGSSFIAEAYYNFGYFSLVVFPFFGWFIKKIDNMNDKALDEWKKNEKKFIVEDIKTRIISEKYAMLYLCSMILFYVRTDTTGFFRNIVLYILIPCFAMKWLSYSRKK